MYAKDDLEQTNKLFFVFEHLLFYSVIVGAVIHFIAANRSKPLAASIRGFPVAMFNNTTCSGTFSKNFSSSSCDNADCAKESEDPYFRAGSISCFLAIAVLSPMAVAGNTLILAAIWRKILNRTPFHVLLSGLAFTDLCTGLIAQPLVAVYFLIFQLSRTDCNEPRIAYTANPVFSECIATYFISVNAVIITIMSVERWLHMTNRSLVASSRGYFVLAISLFIPLPLVILGAFKKSHPPLEFVYNVGLLTMALFCLICTFISYFSVIRIISQHRQQVQANISSANFGKPAINLAKYQKSVKTIMYILGMFCLCFLPHAVCLSVIFYIEDMGEGISLAYTVSLLLLFSSSSINPALYVWRMKDVRKAVRQLLRLNA